MKFQNRQQLLAIIAIAAVALLAGERLVLTPLFHGWSTRAARLAELKKSVDQGTQLFERRTIIQARWEGMRTNCLAPEPSAAENQVRKAFDRWSLESRVGINSIKPKLKLGNDEFITLECRVDAVGSLSSLTRLLYNIEADPMALKLDAAEITSRDDRGEQFTLGLLVNGLMLNSEQER